MFGRRMVVPSAGCCSILISSQLCCSAGIETRKGVRRGDRVWQIAFGSGFKVGLTLL